MKTCQVLCEWTKMPLAKEPADSFGSRLAPGSLLSYTLLPTQWRREGAERNSSPGSNQGSQHHRTKLWFKSSNVNTIIGARTQGKRIVILSSVSFAWAGWALMSAFFNILLGLVRTVCNIRSCLLTVNGRTVHWVLFAHNS